VKHRAEAEEGLALLYARHNDPRRAAELLRKAVADGSKNAYALVEYARIEPDAAKSRAALESAIAADPNSAEAHFFLGQKFTEPGKQIEQFRAAATLAPRRQAYWVALAEALAGQKQWPEASKAWRGAEQAAATPEEREKMMSARLAIEEQRLDFEDAERRRHQEAELRETNRLKQNAIAEIRAAEAKVNQGSAPDPGEKAVPWDELDGAEQHVQGQMIRVECTGRLQRIVLRAPDGKLLKLNADAAGIPKLTCGTQPERAVSVAYHAKPNARTGVAGEATSLQFP
jgi:tetratricopeptide (TPR) repeat protein